MLVCILREIKTILSLETFLTCDRFGGNVLMILLANLCQAKRVNV